MSGVMPEVVPFEVVAERAGAVVVAHPADPAFREEKQTFPGGKIPDYDYRVGLWVVDRLVVEQPGLAIGQTIAVIDPAILSNADAHARYYGDGISQWVIIETYTPAELPGDPARLLFLGTGAGPTPSGASAWALVVSGAVDAPSRADAVVQVRRGP